MNPGERRSSRSHWPEIYANIRERLVRAREEAGLTQRQAANRVQRSQSFVAKSESGERRVDVVELIAFARAYGKSIQDFIPETAGDDKV